MGFSTLPRCKTYRLVKGYTLLEVLIALAIVSLFTVVAFSSLSNLSNILYGVKHRERAQSLVEDLNRAYTLYITGNGVIVDRVQREGKSCSVYLYENYYYTLCEEEGPIRKLYFGSGYNILVSNP